MSRSGFGFARGNLLKLASLPRYAWGALQAKSVRRDPKLWVLGSAFGPTDGALAFWRAASALPDRPQMVWLCRSDQEARQARALGIEEVVDRDSRAGYRMTLKAGLAVVTHGFGDVNRYGLSGSVIVQLWHGAPLKKLHADSPAVTSLGGLGRIPGFAGLVRTGYRLGTSRISLLPTGSSFFAPFLASAFNLERGQVQVLGEPRTDVLFAGEIEARIEHARSLLLPHLGKYRDSKVVLFAPTWRDGGPDPAVPTEQEWLQIGQACERLDLVLLVRPHPLGVGKYPHTSDRVRLITPDRLPESMPLLWGIDLLITDYSSVLVDFVVTGRPALLLAADLEAYQKSRGLYVDFAWLAGGSWSTNWGQVLQRLESVLTDPVTEAEATAHSRKLAECFHERTDGNSAARVAAAAFSLVNQKFS